MVGAYDYWLVLLSIVVAITASYVALDLTSRVLASQGRRSEPDWLVGGAATMGSGLWSMHFIGMLAFRMPVATSYDVPVTILSLLIAVVGSGFALYVTSRSSLSTQRLLAGGALLGFAIAAMHYTGMASMRMLRPIRYDAGLVALSVVIAIATSIAAVWSAFKLRLETVFTAFWKKAGSATVMGAGICAMYYTGMAAARFTPAGVSTAAPDNVGHVALAVILGTFTLVFLMATLLVSALDAYSGERSARQVHDLQALNDELEMRTAELSRINALVEQEVQVRKQTEEALREAHDALETRVAERTAELRRLFDERERLIRDLHDNVVQAIYVAGLKLEQFQWQNEEDPRRAAAEVAAVVGDLNGVIRDIRRYIDRTIGRITVPHLGDELAKLVERFESTVNPRFRLNVDAAAADRLTADEAEHVLQIAREAMSNSLRHSGAEQGRIALEATPDAVRLEVTDDGAGFDPISLKLDGGGLHNMKARAQQIGARLEVQSSPGHGTTLVLHVPNGRRSR